VICPQAVPSTSSGISGPCWISVANQPEDEWIEVQEFGNGTIRHRVPLTPSSCGTIANGIARAEAEAFPATGAACLVDPGLALPEVDGIEVTGIQADAAGNTVLSHYPWMLLQRPRTPPGPVHPPQGTQVSPALLALQGRSALRAQLTETRVAPAVRTAVTAGWAATQVAIVMLRCGTHPIRSMSITVPSVPTWVKGKTALASSSKGCRSR